MEEAPKQTPKKRGRKPKKEKQESEYSEDPMSSSESIPSSESSKKVKKLNKPIKKFVQKPKPKLDDISILVNEFIYKDSTMKEKFLEFSEETKSQSFSTWIEKLLKFFQALPPIYLERPIDQDLEQHIKKFETTIPWCIFQQLCGKKKCLLEFYNFIFVQHYSFNPKDHEAYIKENVNKKLQNKVLNGMKNGNLVQKCQNIQQVQEILDFRFDRRNQFESFLQQQQEYIALLKENYPELQKFQKNFEIAVIIQQIRDAKLIHNCQEIHQIILEKFE